jgi:tryptophan halogenase
VIAVQQNGAKDDSALGDLIRRVVIVGGGLAGWMTAAALAQALDGGPACSIKVIEFEGTNGAGEEYSLVEATPPTLHDFHKRLGLDEDALIRATSGCFKLGTRFTGWSGQDKEYFQAFGDPGASLGPVRFHHFLLERERQGRHERPEDYSLAALAARAGRFSRPSPDSRSILSTFSYALHLDSRAYTDELKRLAKRLGVTGTRAATLRGIARTADGAIETLVLEDGGAIGADLFIDCSGSGAVLTGPEAEAGWEDWGRWAPFDRMREAIVADPSLPAPFAEAAVETAGWLRRAPLQGARSIAYVYSSDFSDDNAASDVLARHAGEDASAAARLTRFSFGRRKRLWAGNCVAIGAAAAELGPTEAFRLQVVQAGVSRLLALFPYRNDYAKAAVEYDRLMGAELEQMRDFAILPYRLNSCRGDPVWDRCRAEPASEGLAYRLNLFESRGRLPLFQEDAFPESSWVWALLGLDVRPRRYDPLADAIEPARLADTLDRMRTAMRQAVDAMPSHADYIRSRCAALSLEAAP